jgi:hypothetical protein
MLLYYQHDGFAWWLYPAMQTLFNPYIAEPPCTPVGRLCCNMLQHNLPLNLPPAASYGQAAWALSMAQYCDWRPLAWKGQHYCVAWYTVCIDPNTKPRVMDVGGSGRCSTCTTYAVHVCSQHVPRCLVC